MDFTTKKILNNGRYILSITYGFLNAITCLIIQCLNVLVATNIIQNNFQKTFSLKFGSSTIAPLSTITKPFIFSSNFESSTSVAPTPLSTTKTTTKTTSTFSSKSESSTLAQPPPATTIGPSLFDSTPYSSPWMYSTSGDLLGSESGVFMASTSELEELEQQWHNQKTNNNIVKTRKQPKNVKKEYPPPIPSWRGKLPSDVPWSLSRHYVDERLILKEESMEYYEYLEATRDNGRLDEDEITHDVTINPGEKKKRIQQEDSKMIDGELGTKKTKTILAI
ncbi:unnamed protein product [Withania somnifera]